MTNSALDKLLKTSEHLDLLSISHTDVTFGETAVSALTVVLSEQIQFANDLKKTLAKLGQKNKDQVKSLLQQRLEELGYDKSFMPIQPKVEKGHYNNGYFISPTVKGTMMKIPGFAILNTKEKCLQIYISGSVSEKEGEIAITHQAEIMQAIKPFLTACVSYAAANTTKIDKIVFAGYSRGATAVINLGATEMMALCEQKNIECEFFPIAALEPIKEIKHQAGFTYKLAPIRLSDIASPDKNVPSNNKTTKPYIPSYSINDQNDTEVYTNVLDLLSPTYLTNANNYIRKHALASYRQAVKEITSDPLYKTALGQIEFPCRIHYVKEKGTYKGPQTKAVFRANHHQLNVVLPYHGTVHIQPSDQKSNVFYFDHPSEAEKVIFNSDDDTAVVMKGRAQEYTATYELLPGNSYEVVVHKIISEEVVGVFTNVDEILFDNSCVKWRDNKLAFSNLSQNFSDRMASCAKSLNPALERSKTSIPEVILVKH